MIVYNISELGTLSVAQNEEVQHMCNAFATLCKGNKWVAICQVNMSFFGKRT